MDLAPDCNVRSVITGNDLRASISSGEAPIDAGGSLFARRAGGWKRDVELLSEKWPGASVSVAADDPAAAWLSSDRQPENRRAAHFSAYAGAFGGAAVVERFAQPGPASFIVLRR